MILKRFRALVNGIGSSNLLTSFCAVGCHKLWLRGATWCILYRVFKKTFSTINSFYTLWRPARDIGGKIQIPSGDYPPRRAGWRWYTGTLGRRHISACGNCKAPVIVAIGLHSWHRRAGGKPNCRASLYFFQARSLYFMETFSSSCFKAFKKQHTIGPFT